jgi:DNA-binding transcriptional regulator GbsR (MarR family)
MPSRLPLLQRRFVEEFGNLYASHGLKRLNGLIIGLLLSAQEPVSLGDIARLLNRSKGLISEAVRRLHSLGFIKKIEGPHSRRDYYTADENTFVNVFHFNMSAVRKNIAIADQFLHELTTARNSQAWKRHLQYMEAFYRQMDAFYAGFDSTWGKTKRNMNI